MIDRAPRPRHRVFIGYESKQDIAYWVLRYSILAHASEPVDIRPLVLSELDFPRPPDPLASTEFTYTRFLVPQLCEFSGTALFMDCDMLCLADLTELFALPLDQQYLRVVKQEHRPANGLKMDGRIQTSYPRKNWSSLMLMDCSRLRIWSAAEVLTRSPAWLHRFEPIADECLGELPPEWNVLDRHDQNTKLIHYTEGGPWLAGHEDHPFGDLWFHYRDRARREGAAGEAGRRCSSRG